jgi:hypothetical protein
MGTRVFRPGFEVIIRDPKVNNVQDTGKENHDKDEFKVNVALQRFKEKLSQTREFLRKGPHENVNNDLGQRQNDHPGNALADPVLPAVRTHVNAGMLQMSPVPLVRHSIQQAQHDNGEKQSQRGVDQVTEAVPGTLVVERVDTLANVIGQDRGNHLWEGAACVRV